MRITIDLSQWQNYWISGRKLRSTSTVCTATINGKLSPFFLSVDGMLGKKALAVIANLSGLMEEKMDEPIPLVQGWINGRIKIVVMR